MGKVYMGPKEVQLNDYKELDSVQVSSVDGNEIEALHKIIAEQELQLKEKNEPHIIISESKPLIQEVIKEVVKIQEVIKEVPVEVIKYVDREVIREIEVQVEKPIYMIEEKIVEVPQIQEVIKTVHKIPVWVYIVMILESLGITLLLIGSL